MNIPHTRPWFPESMRRDILADLDKVMASGQLMGGEFSKTLERQYAERTQTGFGVSLATATTGLQIALRYSGVAGGEVLVPAASFITDVSAVQMEGATPVLVDVDPETLAFDLEDLERKVTDRTKAIIWVHLIGYIAETYRDIQAFAARHKLFLIEDASHAHGAMIDDKPAGSLGDVGVFSFYPTKIMTTGTGGMLVTDDGALSDFAQSLRLFGKDLKTGEIVHRGNDWFMDEFRACIGVHQARHLDEILARRRAAVDRYLTLLRDCNYLRCLAPSASNQPAWYQFPVFADDGIDAEAVRRKMGERNIACKLIYKPVHEEVLFESLAQPGLSRAENSLNQSLCLPLFTAITEEEIDASAKALMEILSEEAGV
ncbi:MAG: DegT/DnrJ/EryC1/StrS family aminotransferase [Rhodospirillaceae bacterium]|nr:DegT/DnrJ/EryC1/StrS family aminotransferase [Rhodospirillaceae bacterium]MDD9927212.1 DegT/DnrJ/EryC1/StrS family aminotransferase [Rhodospirillaceae bacterium]